MAFFSTLSFLNISRWFFRSLRKRVWGKKTLTVAAKYHTQNISLLFKSSPEDLFLLLILEREKETLIGRLLYMPQPGIEPSTWVWCFDILRNLSGWGETAPPRANQFLEIELISKEFLMPWPGIKPTTFWWYDTQKNWTTRPGQHLLWRVI